MDVRVDEQIRWRDSVIEQLEARVVQLHKEVMTMRNEQPLLDNDPILPPKQQPGAASGESTREVQPDTFEAMGKRWRNLPMTLGQRRKVGIECADELASLSQHYVSKERVREAMTAAKVAQQTIAEWTRDEHGRVHIHPDVISKAVNAAVVDLETLPGEPLGQGEEKG